MTALDRRRIGIVGCAHAMVHIFEQALPALFPILMVEFALSVTAVSNVQFGLALAFGVCALPAGVLASRWGPERVVQLYLLIASVGALVMAFAPTAAVLTVGAVGVGVGLGLYHPAGTSYLATQVRARSKAMGYHGVGGGLGVSTGPVLTVVLYSLLGWSYTLVVYAGVGLTLIYLLRHLPGMMPAAERAPEAHAIETPPPQGRGETDLPRLSLLIAAGSLVGFVYRGAITFLPLYIGYSLAGPGNAERAALLGGVCTSAALYVGMVAQWLGGQLGERYSPTALFAIGHTVSVPCLLLLAFAKGPAVVGLAALFAFGHFFAQPLGNLLVADYTSLTHRDRGFGWYFAFAFGLGAFAAAAGGRVGESFALSTIFVMLAGTAALAVGTAWWLHLAPRRADSPLPRPAEVAS